MNDVDPGHSALPPTGGSWAIERGLDTVQPAEVRFGATLLLSWVGGFLPIESGPIWIPATAAHYHQSAVTVGAIASLQLLLSAVAALFVAPRLGRANPRHALMIGTVIVLTAAICSMVPLPFAAFATLRIVEGVGSGLCIAVGGMLATRTALPTRTFGFLQLGQVTGTLVVFSAAAPLIARFGTQSIYAVVLAISFIALVLLVKHSDWLIRTPPTTIRSDSTTGRGELIIACIGITLVFCAFIGVVTSAGVLGANAGLSLGQIGIALAMTTPASACASITALVLGSRMDRRWLLGISIVGAVGSGALIAFTVHSVLSLALAIGALAFSIYLAVPTIFATVSRMRSRGGTSAAAAQAAQMLGVALGPITGASIVIASVSALGLFAGAAVAAGLGMAARQTGRGRSCEREGQGTTAY